MRRSAALLLLALVGCDGCEDQETLRRKKATREGMPAAAASTDQTIKPVYPAKAGEAPPLVTRLCDALHGLPRRRQAECCDTTPGVVLTSECTRNLTGALADGAVTLGEDAVTACKAAMEKAHAGCEWIGPWPVPTPKECRALVTGTKREGDKCRSSLECRDGLRCRGVGPTDPGVCGPPASHGGLCGAAVDTLAVYVRQDDVDTTSHPACADGWCDRNHCRPLVETGGKCTASVQCDDGRCIEGACVSGRTAAVGQRCSGGECVPGARCIQGTCRTPKRSGESCGADDECLGACMDGACKMRCTNPALRRGLIKLKTE